MHCAALQHANTPTVSRRAGDSLVVRLSVRRAATDIRRITPPRRTRRIRLSVCAVLSAVGSTAVLSGVASAENGGRCDSPGNHYGFTCDPPPSGTSVAIPAGTPPSGEPAPAAPSPAPSPSAPILTRPLKIASLAGGGAGRIARV
jgi:hypothetical protein